MTVWQAGMRCVFVREYDVSLAEFGFVLPVKGRVYSVREVVVSEIVGEVCLRLVEISNVHTIGRIVRYAGRNNVRIAGEPAFEADRFRPLSDTSLDQFRRLLAPDDRVPA